MATKLALHCHRSGPDIDAAIRACQWAACKALDTVLPLQTAQAAGIPIRILRVFGVEALAPADAAARFLAHDLGAATHLQLVCEQAQGYDPAWQGAVIAALRAGGYRGACLLGGFSVGTPAQIVQTDHPHLPQLEPLYPLLRAGHPLGVDAYTAILASDPRWGQWAPYTVGRAALLHDCLLHHGIDARMVVLESGGDNAPPVPSGGGWLGRGWSAADYLATLQAIDRDDQAHPWLLARCIFTLGAPGDWSQYEIASIVPQLAAYVQSQKGPPMLKLLDLSKVNNVTDWSALAAAYDGVIVQTSYGGVSAEPRGAEYWAAAKAHGLLRLAYHYLYPQYNTPDLEAANFLRNVTIEPGDGWAVDVEEPCPDPAAYSSAFMQIVEQATFAPRNWYSYPAYIAQYGITAARVGNPHLWLASYRGSEPDPPPGWASIEIWQHTSNAVVPGVDGVVDEDLVFMTREQFAALCKPADPPNGGTVTDPITALALSRAKAANPAISPNVDSANFLAYREQIRVYDANGRPNYLDPGPWLRNEAATATDAYVPLDSGMILHSTNKSGQWVTYLAEAKERASIYAACGWGAA